MLKISQRSPDWRIILFWALVVVVCVQALASGLNFLDGRIWDWAHFYYAAQALTAGEDPFASGDQGYIYPIVFAWILQPATSLGLPGSAMIWTLLMGGALAGSLLIVRKAFIGAGAPPAAASLAVAIGAVLVADKFVSTLKSAQTDGLILVACLAALMFIRTRPVLAGLMIAVAAALKYHALLFVILFLFRRRWRAAGAAVTGFAVLLFLPSVTVGWSENLQYIRDAFSGVIRMVGDLPLVRGQAEAGEGAMIAPITWDRSVSATSAAMRLGQQLPDALSFLGPLVLMVVVSCAGVVAARGYLKHDVSPFGPLAEPDRKRPMASDLCDWALVLTSMVVLSPQSTGRHFTYVLLPLSMIGLMALRAADRTTRRFFAFGAVGFLLALNMPLSEYEALMNAWRSLSSASWVLMLLVAALPASFLRLQGGSANQSAG